MSNQKSMIAGPLTDMHHRNNAVGMWISSSVLERVCKKMIKTILYCLPHATRGTIYSVGPIPDLRVLRIASGHRDGQSDEITWDLITRSDYDFPGKEWEDYRDRPGGILEAMAWCIEKQKSWTADDPENNVRCVRKQLEGRASEDYHHMEPVLVNKIDLWDVTPPPDAFPKDTQGKTIWQDTRSATVAVIKIHFLPETVRRGDRSTRIIKELSQSLGTEILSLHAREIALEKEKRLVEERKNACDTLAHDFRNLMARVGFAYRAINNEIAYLRESWEDLVDQHLPEDSSKRAMLVKLNQLLKGLEVEASRADIRNDIMRLSRYQKQLRESCLLPHQNEMWLQHKIRPLWLSVIEKLNLDTESKRDIEEILQRLRQAFYLVQDETVIDRIDSLPANVKSEWIKLVYCEINTDTNGMMTDYISLLNDIKLDIPRIHYSLKNFIYFKSLIELLPDVEKKLNNQLELLNNHCCDF